VLASGSPRRRQLLAELGLRFEVRPPDIDETPRPHEPPVAYVERLAREKATAAAAQAARDEVLVAADTTVDLDGEIIGKPIDLADAVATLRRLAGRAHHVHTGVAVARGARLASSVTTSTVVFHDLPTSDLEAIALAIDPLDKAGGYTLQGEGARLVASIEGSVSNVAGLPVAQTEGLLAELGFELVQWGPPR